MRIFIINIILILLTSIIGGYIGGNAALKKFETNHSTLTIYQKDAEFLFNDTQSKIFGEKETPY